MEIKSEANYFNISKICRTCLIEKDVMQTLFALDKSIGQSVAERIMDFANVKLEDGDGLPSLICSNCVHEVNRAFSFKQLCEQSDLNLRRYLGRPPIVEVTIKQEEGVETTDYDHTDNIRLNKSSDFGVVSSSIDNFKLDDSSKKCDGDDEDQKDSSMCAVPVGPLIKQEVMVEVTDHEIVGGLVNNLGLDKKKKHECEVCKKRFIRKIFLIRHMKKHSKEKPFVCKICYKGCSTEYLLLKHMKHIHEKKHDDPRLLKHTCDYCRIELPDAASLDIHIKQHTGDRPFLCTTCGKSFPHRFNFELHLRSHTDERPFSCEICQKKFRRKGSLEDHMKTHSNEKPFACQFCGKAFRNRSGLMRHELLHKTEKSVQCNTCQKRYKTVSDLKVHMKTHTNERPFVCELCGKAFRRFQHLKTHKQLHRTEEPYECNTCQKRFLTIANFKYHMQNQTCERP